MPCVTFMTVYTMRNRCIVAILLLTTWIGAASAKSLVLTLSGGKRVYYLLGGDVDPMMRFVDGAMTVGVDGYSFVDVKNFYISSEDDPSGVEQILMSSAPSYKGNVLCMQASGKVSVMVYAADGRNMQAPVRVVDDMVCVDLNPLPTGLYVVSVGEASLKVVKE